MTAESTQQWRAKFLARRSPHYGIRSGRTTAPCAL